MSITLWAIILVASLYVLVKSADYFTDYAERFGKLIKLPNFVIGVLILAVGTSLPELATSILGVHAGEMEFLSGTVLGSSIANIFLVLGVAVLFCRKKAIFTWDVVSNDLPFYAAAIFLVIVAMLDGSFSFVEALIFIAGYLIYVAYTYYAQKSERTAVKEKFYKELQTEIREKIKQAKIGGFISKLIKPDVQIVIIMLISLGVVVGSSKFVVDSVINLAGLLGLGTSVLAATAVAIGTSLPEVLVSISAARRGNFDMVIGNILGSNIFNIFVVYGVVGTYTTLTISTQMFMILMPFLVGSFFLFWLVLLDKKVSRTEAGLFLLIYVLFLGKMFAFF